MDDAPGEENEGQDTSGHDVQKSGQEEKLTDKPVQRASLKEKLEAFKVKAAGAEKHESSKEKGKEVAM